MIEDVKKLLRAHVATDDREEADRIAMLRLAEELENPISRDQVRAHFTASAFVIDVRCERVCLVEHVKLGRLLQPGGHVEAIDESLEAAALREAVEETNSSSTSIRPRRGRSTSTSTRSRSARRSRRTSISTFATCSSGPESRAPARRGT